MEIFQKRLRGLHARSVENIMARTIGAIRSKLKTKKQSIKNDSINTYMRKVQIERENLNLAKRIMECESEHSRNKYNKDWKKTKNFLKVRSNFKRSICNEEPRIFKFEKISGQGKVLVTVAFESLEACQLKFKAQNLYTLRVQIGNSSITPTNGSFTLETISQYIMAFYVPSIFKKKKLMCRIIEAKENNIFQKGKFAIDLNSPDLQEVKIIKGDKVEGIIKVKVNTSTQNHLKSHEMINLNTRSISQLPTNSLVNSRSQ